MGIKKCKKIFIEMDILSNILQFDVYIIQEIITLIDQKNINN